MAEQINKYKYEEEEDYSNQQEQQQNQFASVQLESEGNQQLNNRGATDEGEDSDQDDPQSQLNKQRSYIPKYAGFQAARDLKPTGEEISQMMHYLDLATKCEIFIYDMQSVLFWGAIVEVLMFLLGFILFCVVPELMSFIWLHIMHLPRGILGFILLTKLPRSHQVIEQLSITEAHYSFKQVCGLLQEQISKIFIEYSEKCKSYLLAYLILTVFTIFFDLIEFIIQFIRFGRQGDEHSDLAMLALTVIFLGIDFFYVIWVVQAKQKFPESISTVISKALFGLAGNLMLFLHARVNEIKAAKSVRRQQSNENQQQQQ